MSETDIIKKPRQKLPYSKQDLIDLANCQVDPIYFIENFVKIQHPTKGTLPFEPYPFQNDLIRAFHENRFTIALTARQMGKCVDQDTMVVKNGESVSIGSLVPSVGLRERLVRWLERAALRLAIRAQ